MIVAVCVCECVQGIVAVYAEFVAGNEYGSACTKGNVAHAVAYGSGSDCGCCVVSGSCYNFTGLRQSKFCCYFRF